MKTIKIKHQKEKRTENYEIEIDKIVYILSKLENNDHLKFKNHTYLRP